MKGFFRFVLWATLYLGLLLAVLATIGMVYAEVGVMPNITLSVDGEQIYAGVPALPDVLAAVLAAIVVVFVVLPIALLVGVGVPALVIGILVLAGLGAAGGAAALLSSPVVLLILLVWWVARRANRRANARAELQAGQGVGSSTSPPPPGSAPPRSP